MHCLYTIGDELDEGGALAILRNLVDNGLISAQVAHVASAAISQNALASLPAEMKKSVRADIFRQLILSFMK